MTYQENILRENSRKPIALSFDVECYYQIVAKDYLGEMIRPTSEVLRNTSWILDLLKKYDAKGTFFFLGNVAENFPELVRRAVDEGHEIGVHGDEHRYVCDMDQEEFRTEIASALGKIRAAGAARVMGHRATAFSIGRTNLWALDTLRELGVEYDSSIFPLQAARYGISDWPRAPRMTSSGIPEVPMSVVSIAGRKLACMGGGYVRYFPIAYTRWCAERLHREGLIPVSYFHPYEFELSKPRFDSAMMASLDKAAASRLKKFNRMQGIGRGQGMRRKLEWLLKNYRAVPVGSLAGLGSPPATVERASLAKAARAGRGEAPAPAPKTVLLTCSDARSLRNFRGRLIEAMRERNHKVVAVAPSFPPQIRDWCDELGVFTETVSINNQSLNPLPDLATVVSLYRIIRRIKPDVVMGYTHKPAIYTAYAARLAGIPHVSMMVTGMGFGFEPGDGFVRKVIPSITKMLFRAGCSASNRVIFHNQDNREFFLREKLLKTAGKAAVVGGSGVDLDHFRPIPLPPAAPGALNFMLVARIVRYKGILEYARAAESLKERYPSAQFLLAGYRDSNPLAYSAEEWQLIERNLTYLGPSDDVRPLYARSHVYVLPSYGEGMPRTVLEAMATGRAIITTETYGCRDTVEEGMNGHLVPVRAWEPLAVAMESFLSGRSSAQAMGGASRKMAERLFDVKAVNNDMLAALNL